MRPRLSLAAALLLLLSPRRSCAAAEEESCAAPDLGAAPAQDVCGSAFFSAAAAELHALQHPAESDCATARLLVLSTEAEHFEGLGSVLMAAAEGLAEAHAARRTLVLGPVRAAPALLREARCAGGAAWECAFAPLGACGWRHVTAGEAAALPAATDSCDTRVKASTPTRGAAALYAPPRHLRAALPPGAAPEDAAECWAAALLAYVARLQPDVEASLAAKRSELFPGQTPYVGAHLRVGDTAMEALEYGGRVYTNKPAVTAELLGARLVPLLRGAATRNLYLATDAEKARAAADAVSSAADARVALLPRFRTPHGSHTSAFATSRAAATPLLPVELLAPLLAPGGRYAGAAGRDAAAADQEAVRREALEDLYLLSHAAAIAGTAASHFSVAARLWGLARGQRLPSVAWMDAEGVAAGVLATGFMHGQVNTTFALIRPEQRALIATRRMLDEPLADEAPPGDVITFHPERCVPIVPRGAMRRLRAAWGCEPGAPRADDFARRCAECIMQLHGGAAGAQGDALGGECDTVAELVNAGVDFWEGFNAELAFACWRAVLALPADVAAAGGADVLAVARDNLAGALAARRSRLRLYLPPADGGATRVN